MKVDFAFKQRCGLKKNIYFLLIFKCITEDEDNIEKLVDYFSDEKNILVILFCELYMEQIIAAAQ